MLKILIVDDEPDICELIHKLIDWEALKMTSLGSSQNGIDAMEIILRQKPDIVITDIQMPGMTGLEMTENRFRQHCRKRFRSSKPLVNTRPFAPCRPVRRSSAMGSVLAHPLRQRSHRRRVG